MKGFGIEVKNDLLEYKHHENMGDSVWLYLWLLDKTTSVSEDGIGKILGGKPIKYEDVSKDLRLSQNTYTRYISRLRKHGYIMVTRAPNGLIFKITKAHKRFSNKYARSGVLKNNDEPSLQNRFIENQERFTKNGDSPKMQERFTTNRESDSPQTGNAIKTVTVDSNKDITPESSTQRKENPSQKNITMREIYFRRKKLVFEKYSNGSMSCKICGEKDIDLLALDHINNDGASHRRETSKHVYDWLVKNNFPEGYQILCFNCNIKKQREKVRSSGKEKFSIQGADILKAFESINPMCKKYYGRPPQRQACDDLIKEYGFERVKIVVEKTLPKTNGMQFFPTITTPMQLRDKWMQLESAIRKHQDKINSKKMLIV